MSKVRNFVEIAPNIGLSEFNFYNIYHSIFETSELGRIMKLLPLREMAENFGLVSKSMRPRLGSKSYFTPEGKEALMFLKMYTGLGRQTDSKLLGGEVLRRIMRRCAMEIYHVRSILVAGSFGTQKEHYDLKRVKARTKKTEILYIFFGIHTANVVQLASKIAQRVQATAA